jgi:hypothetical protein
LCHLDFRKVLDIEGDAKRCARLITFEKRGRANQQWRIDSCDSALVNPCSNLVVDVEHGVVCEGQGMIAYPKDGNISQQFCIQFH